MKLDPTRRKRWQRRLVLKTAPMAILFAALLVLGVSAQHGSDPTNLPSASAPVQGSASVPASSAAAAPQPSSTSGFTLPKESESDSPQTVVEEVNTIYNRAVTDQNYGYFRYVYSNGTGGMSQATWAKLIKENRLAIWTIVTNDPTEPFQATVTGPDTFTASYYSSSPGSPDAQETIYYTWYPQVQEWLISGSPDNSAL